MKDMGEAMATAIAAVTKRWTVIKRDADKKHRLNQSQFRYYAQQSKVKPLSTKEAAYQVMKQAYLKASANGTLPANARQIMYAARPMVIALTGKTTPWKHSSYFTQHLLPDYVAENPNVTANWDVVFDARGHLIEPHTDHRIDLGTLEVRQYVASWRRTREGADDLGITLSRDFKTKGPENRYKFVLFVEKEGFNPLFKAIRLAARFDLAIMSTKGMSVTASRRLVEELSKKDVTILVLHDFDKSGFSIVHTLRTDTRRYQFAKPPNVIDLGLRLDDVEQLGLESEPVDYDSDPRPNLRESGATDEEISFLVDEGRRVEINAMPSDVMTSWLEAKLIDAGVTKVVPGDNVLKEAWKEAVVRAKVQTAIDEALEEAKEADEPMPDGLADEIRRAIDNTAEPWDIALWERAFEQVTKNQEEEES